MKDDDRIAVSIPEAERLTSLSRSHLYDLMKRGKLDYTNVGRRRLVFVEGLKRLLSGDREAA